MYYKDIVVGRKILDGGQKSVFIAKDSSGCDIVYKTCKPQSINQLERFRRELEYLHSSHSVHFPFVVDYHIDTATNEIEILEEYIDGGSLTDKLNIPWTENDSIALLKKLLVPCRDLWNKNIIHRDIKPDNIMFRKNNDLVLIDLGIARFLDYSSLTNSMNVLGPCTPIYAAPEQLVNQKRIIDFRTDLFSIGIVILQAFLGYHPFDPCKIPNSRGDILQNIMSGVFAPAKAKGTCSSAFDFLVNKLLKTRQYQRFCSITDLSTYIAQNWR